MFSGWVLLSDAYIFHGMEEVVSSNLTRSTKRLQSSPSEPPCVACGFPIDRAKPRATHGGSVGVPRRFDRIRAARIFP